jgi:hypothetical protein
VHFRDCHFSGLLKVEEGVSVIETSITNFFGVVLREVWDTLERVSLKRSEYLTLLMYSTCSSKANSKGI